MLSIRTQTLQVALAIALLSVKSMIDEISGVLKQVAYIFMAFSYSQRLI